MTNRNQGGVWSARLWLTLITAAIAIATIVEVAVALNLWFARPWTHKAMLGGSILWIVVAALATWLSRKGAGRIHVLVCPVSRDNRRLFCGGILHGVDVDVRALGKRATVRHSLWGSYVGISTAVERRGN